MTITEISEYILEFYKKILGASEICPKKFDITEIKEYIDANYSKDIYLEQIADKYRVSLPYVSKVLKESLGMTFNAYLASLRIMKAKELLSGSMSVNEVCKAVGFNNRNTFFRSFKKMEGISPTDYKRATRKK